MKWYIACSRVSLAIGGSTPNASAVRKMIVDGWPATPLLDELLMKSSGKAPRVFSVNSSESRSSSLVAGSIATFSRIVPKRRVVE